MNKHTKMSNNRVINYDSYNVRSKNRKEVSHDTKRGYRLREKRSDQCAFKVRSMIVVA